MHRRQQSLRRVVWVIGGLMAAVTVAFFFGEMSIPKYLGMKKNVQALEQEIQELARTNADLRRDITRLQKDPARIEEVARERLGLVRKGETVYQIVEEPGKTGGLEKIQ
jgi:cell division protein FtsB